MTLRKWPDKTVTRTPTRQQLPAHELPFQQWFTSATQGDTQNSIASRQVPEAMWSHVPPATFRKPQLISWVPEIADALRIDIEADQAAAAEVFTGTLTPDNTLPYAMRYGGHQFGNWAGQLGDGRAIALGELIDASGKHWTLQLKGAGPTPYSRQGDGYAVLRSSIREYLCAEAMHHLGIPTTRSLTLCLTGEHIERDVFYNGNVEDEPGAVVCRVAESFIRFGSFEIHAAHRETTQLKQLADFVIREHYPHLWQKQPNVDTYQSWFAEVLQRTAHLIAEWQRVGFVHAVMNTDNMSILGQTIDYGPYGWLEEYDTSWTPNFVDQHGRRYSFGNQSQIALWNLYRLANAILPIFDDETRPLQEVLETYDQIYQERWDQIRKDKTGLSASDEDPDDKTLADRLWRILDQSSPDYTVFFRILSETEASASAETLADRLCTSAYYQAPDDDTRELLTHWITDWQKRLNNADHQKATQIMQATNPKYVLRNYIAIEAIDAAEKGDFSILHNISELIKSPYSNQSEFERYAALRPDWAKVRPGCTMLTCSS